MGLLNYTTTRINELLAKVASLPAKVMDGDTKIPSKTSDLTNDSKFVKETGLKTVNGQSLLGAGDIAISGGSGGGESDSVDWANVQNKPSWVNSNTKPSYTASDVGALPSNTTIPSKTSQLQNDCKFVKETGLKTVNGQSLVGSGNITISGGSGGGGGNVNVTNAGSLVKGRLYTFNPSANGSLDGTFSTIPEASSAGAGLMGADMYNKLMRYKDACFFPATVLSLTAASTSNDILTAFGLDPVNENADIAILTSLLASGQSKDYTENIPKCFIGNHECGVYASHESTTYTLELSYIDQGGVLKTVRVTGKEGTDSVITYSVDFSESGGDEVYLPLSIFDLTTSSTHEEVAAILDYLGGIEHIIGMAQKVTTKFYIVDSANTVSNMRSCVNITGYTIANILHYIDISYVDASLISYSIKISGTKSNYTVKTRKDINLNYTIGYQSVKSEVYDLNSSSTSDEIRSAFYNVDTFKRVIEAVKNGTILRTSIPASISTDYTNPVYLNTFAAHVTNDGDATLGYTIAGLGINSFMGMQFVVINYEAFSDSFSINVIPFTIGG